MAVASVLLATSCSENQDVIGENLSNQTIQINPSVGHSSSRAVETDIKNLGEFYVTSFQANQVNYMDKVLYANKSNTWTTDAGKFFWPVEGNLHFYGYAPAAPGAAGIFNLISSKQELTDFTPNATAATQKDFVYAYAKGNLTANGESGIGIDFKHALSEITVVAKNSNTAYTVEVTGVKLGHVKNKGSFTFPAVGGATSASWKLSSVVTDVADYTTTWTTANKLVADASSLDASNVAFMALPQQLATNTKASAGNYIALKVKITTQGKRVIHDGWAYIGIDTNWEMGKRYAYTLDFSNGAGQTEAGKMIISGKDVKVITNVTDWDAKAVDLPEVVISGTATGVFSYKVGGTINKVTPDASGNWNIPVTNFDGVTKMNDMFYNCRSLTSLDLSHFNTSKVTDMSAMFFYCSSLMTLDLSHFDTSNVTDMRGIFSGCTSLTTLDLSGWDTGCVTSMFDMFNFCTSLTTLDLSGWDTGCVTSMSGMFHFCNSLTTLDLSGWNTSNVTNMGYMFDCCRSLTTLDLSHFDTSNVTNMAWMFSNCNSLTNIDLSHFDTSNVTNMYCMFWDCTSLTTLDLSHFDMSNVTNMKYMFSNCTNLKTITMKGCSQETINKIKTQLSEDGVTGCQIITE